MIRINAAPTTSQYDEAVGRRTTWRVHNSEKPYFLAALGMPELQLLICHMGWIGSCQHQAFSGAYTESTAYVNPAFYSQLWGILGRPDDKQTPSTGLLAIALALGACDSVTLFGFGAAGAAGAGKCGHYWECGKPGGTEAGYYDPMHTFHDWLAEEALRTRWTEAGFVTNGHAAFANASAARYHTSPPHTPSAAEARAAVTALPRRDHAAVRARWAAMQPEWLRERAALRAKRKQRKGRRRGGARAGGRDARAGGSGVNARPSAREVLRRKWEVALAH